MRIITSVLLDAVLHDCSRPLFLLISFPSVSSGSAGDANSVPWTTEEQKLLEQALKTYPVNTPERWDKIAATVPGRTKKDCMKRYKVSVPP